MPSHALIALVMMGSLAIAEDPVDPTEKADWVCRPLVGEIVAVLDDGCLQIAVAEVVTQMTHVEGRGMVPQRDYENPLGLRVFRLAGVDFKPAAHLQRTREWLVGMPVRLQIGKPFAADDADEPVPVVLYERNVDVLLNQEVVRRQLARPAEDLPGALGTYERRRIAKSAY